MVGYLLSGTQKVITSLILVGSQSVRANWRGLYGITNRSISVDRGLYGPSNILEVFTFDS